MTILAKQEMHDLESKAYAQKKKEYQEILLHVLIYSGTQVIDS